MSLCHDRPTTETARSSPEGTRVAVTNEVELAEEDQLSNSCHRSRFASRHAAVLTLRQSRHSPFGLADDTLEAPLLGDAQQRQAVFERFGQRDGRAAEALQGPGGTPGASLAAADEDHGR